MSEIINQRLQIQNVWENEDAYSSSITFWERIMSNTGFDTAKRAKEVICQVKLDEKVIGVSTAHEIEVPNFNNNSFFSYRMLIDPEYRIPGLSDKLISESFEFLEGLYVSGRSKSIGIITLIENPELIKKRKELVYPTSKLVLAGYTKKGKQIRLRYFKGAMI
ncbi:hypothetical protein [Fulvivirga lutimaris]|uniref:hypothetical protein n=1 Tax=Fulvivirga lutimaris TaxID=1819566 RepID=UPI0012BD47D4|nr:hypothetical protein [Fulvivirga lutimaris]MTI38068.1 hypothetical protein [Fulvivirga lutimaris]